jgi:hypothetical protein
MLRPKYFYNKDTVFKGPEIFYFFTLTFQIENPPGNMGIELITFVKHKFILQLLIEAISYWLYHMTGNIFRFRSVEYNETSLSFKYHYTLEEFCPAFQKVSNLPGSELKRAHGTLSRGSQKSKPRKLSTNIRRKIELFNYSENRSSLGGKAGT